MWAIVAIAGAGFALAGVLVGVIVHLVRQLDKATTNERSGEMAWRLENQKLHDAELRIASLKDANEGLDAAVKQQAHELVQVKQTLLKVEVSRDELLAELAKSGDPRGVASRIAAELRAASEMSRARQTTARSSGPGHSQDGAVSDSVADTSPVARAPVPR